MSEELKPCPFCGAEAELREVERELPFSTGDENIFFAICTNCGCSPFPRSGTNIYYKKNSKEIKQKLEKEAAEAWNHRA